VNSIERQQGGWERTGSALGKQSKKKFNVLKGLARGCAKVLSHCQHFWLLKRTAKKEQQKNKKEEKNRKVGSQGSAQRGEGENVDKKAAQQ